MKTYPKHLKAEESVSRCCEFLVGLGYSVSTRHVTANGHDIVALRRGKALTIEVKTAFYSARAWKTSRIFNCTSDLVCVVFPCGYCLFEDSRHYTKTAAKSGEKCYTKVGSLLLEEEQ